MAEGKDNGGKKRQRSPNYPAIGLRDAVDRVAKLYKEDGRPGAPMETAVKHFGFTSAHGQAMTIVSALKKFGLVEDRNGRIIPTKLAIDIAEFTPSHQRHIEALREAALKPEIYAELVEQYREHGRLPSDDSLRPELVTDKGFNPKAVTGFLADFRNTLEFAGLLEGNTLKLSRSVEEEFDENDEPDEGANEMNQDTEARIGKKRDGGSSVDQDSRKQSPKDDPWNGPSVRFDLPRGNVIEIRLKTKVTPQEFQKIKKIFDLSEVAFVEDESIGEEFPFQSAQQ